MAWFEQVSPLRELSVKRAQAVRDFLVSRGVHSARIRAEGLGLARPVATHATAEGARTTVAWRSSSIRKDHFAPDKHPHGLPTAAAHHLGDLGNVETGPNGTADFEIVVPKANLQKGHDRSWLNRALVIHEKRDTGTGKSGESGAAPIACATIVGD